MVHDDLTGATWRKSSYSGSGNACLELAALDGDRAIRDSKNPSGPALMFTTAEWSAFTTSIRTGKFS